MSIITFGIQNVLLSPVQTNSLTFILHTVV